MRCRNIGVRNLNYFKILCRRNRDGSYAVQAQRSRVLDPMANPLHEMRPGNLRAHPLKARHIDLPVKRWRGEGLSTGTLKNRMTALRGLVEALGKQNIVHHTSQAYGMADRDYGTSVSKAKPPNLGQLDTLGDPFDLAPTHGGTPRLLWAAPGA
jgi:site-specific recombinase XerC